MSAAVSAVIAWLREHWRLAAITAGCAVAVVVLFVAIRACDNGVQADTVKVLQDAAEAGGKAQALEDTAKAIGAAVETREKAALDAAAKIDAARDEEKILLQQGADDSSQEILDDLSALWGATPQRLGAMP